MSIRVREQADLAACVGVLRRTHELASYPLGWPEDPSRWLNPPAILTALVAVFDGAVVGHSLLRDTSGQKSRDAWQSFGLDPAGLGLISRLFVDPALHRKGAGRLLLQHSAEAAVARYLTPALDVLELNKPAIEMYEEMGWKRVGSQPFDPHGDAGLLHYYVLFG